MSLFILDPFHAVHILMTSELLVSCWSHIIILIERVTQAAWTGPVLVASDGLA